jgi:hypothetical protein
MDEGTVMMVGLHWEWIEERLAHARTAAESMVPPRTGRQTT